MRTGSWLVCALRIILLLEFDEHMDEANSSSLLIVDDAHAQTSEILLSWRRGQPK